ncbi:MAG: flagellar export chaperone FliS [Planctomycetota bacterium]
MSNSVRSTYLETEVLTATPQKLQLMVIDAAIRSATRGRELLQAEDFPAACDALIHAQDCVGEILGALNREVEPETTGRMTSVYLFILRSLMESNLHHDVKRVDDALRVLETERETWREICERFGSRQEAGAPSSEGADYAAAVPIPVAELDDEALGSPGGLSLEA